MINLKLNKNRIEPSKDHRLTFPISHRVGCSCDGFLFGFFIGGYYEDKIWTKSKFC